MVDDDFNQIEYLENYLKPICDLVRKNHIYYLTIPLLEKSSVVDYDVRDEFANAIYPYLCDYPDIKFLFEAADAQDPREDAISGFVAESRNETLSRSVSDSVVWLPRWNGTTPSW